MIRVGLPYFFFGVYRFCSRRAPLIFITDTRLHVFLRFCVHLRILRDVSRKGYISAGFYFCLKARLEPNSREEDAQPWNTAYLIE